MPFTNIVFTTYRAAINHIIVRYGTPDLFKEIPFPTDMMVHFSNLLKI